jgi:hypothetical protein
MPTDESVGYFRKFPPGFTPDPSGIAHCCYMVDDPVSPLGAPNGAFAFAPIHAVLGCQKEIVSSRFRHRKAFVHLDHSGLELAPSSELVTSNGTSALEVLVEMKIEMAVHVDGADRNRALVVQIITAATTQGQVSAGRVNGP